MAYLEYLQSILIEFDDSSPDESYLIRFFCDGLRPSIKVQIEKKGQKLCNWEDFVQKAIKTKAKASFLLLSMVYEMDQHVVCSKIPAKTTRGST